MKSGCMVLLVVACLMGLVPGLAAETRIALVMGNAAYGGESSLKNPVNDATDMANSLRAIGWTVDLVTDADRRSANRSIAAFRDKLAASEGASALFYYAGHGIQVDGANYLLPVNTTFETADDIRNDAISIQTVTVAIEQARAGVSLIILDACRDNPFARKMTRSLGGTRGLTVVQSAGGSRGSAIMFATSPGDVAQDGGGRNGLFTTVLLKYLASDLKIEDLFKRVTGEVRQNSGDQQKPWINASLASDFYFVSDTIRQARLAESKRQADELRKAELAKASESGRQAEMAKTEVARQEAEAARKLAADALAAKQKAESEAQRLAALQAASNSRGGLARIESYQSGTVWRDQILIGTVGPDSPLVMDQLPVGKVEFRFMIPDRPPEVRNVSITDMAYTTVVFGTKPTAYADSRPARLTLITEPEGVGITVDDTTRLITPATITLPSGNHKLQVDPGMSTTGRIILAQPSQTISLQAGDSVTLPVKVALGQGDVKLRLAPRGYTVYANDQRMGITPMEQFSVPAGAVSLRFEKAGQDSFDVDTYIGPDNSRTITWGLNRNLPLTLERRTIAMDGKAANWNGIEPVFVQTVPQTFLGKTDYGISRLYVCRDEKNLYWRVDFEKSNPLSPWRVPSNALYRVLCNLEIFYPLGTINLTAKLKKDTGELIAEAGMGGSGGWKELAYSKLSSFSGDWGRYNIETNMIVGSIALKQLQPWFDQAESIKVTVAHAPASNKGWDSNVQTDMCFIDFRQ